MTTSSRPKTYVTVSGRRVIVTPIGRTHYDLEYLDRDGEVVRYQSFVPAEAVAGIRRREGWTEETV